MLKVYKNYIKSITKVYQKYIDLYKIVFYKIYLLT